MKKITIFLLFSTIIFANKVSTYKPIWKCFERGDTQYVAIREFGVSNKNSSAMLLAINSQTLDSKIFYKKDINATNCYESRYFDLLEAAAKEPYPLENDGIVESNSSIVLTTDLCPSSKKGFEKRLYQTLFTKFKKPVPVTLFITKRWIRKHFKEFKLLKQWQKEGKLNITWGNHTAYHHYHPKAKLEHNYVLSPEENLQKDILDLEIELLNRGIIPTPFFRFPGLVSDKKSVNIVKNLGLIIIGSNAWLANGDKIKPNSIILLHGNKNEPRGVDMFFKELKKGKIKELKDIKEAL